MLESNDGGASPRRRWFVAGLVFGIVLGVVIGFGVVVGIVATADKAGGEPLDHVHASQLHTRTAGALAREFRRFRAADVVTWTEVGGRAAVLRSRAGWRTYARPGRTDVAVSWRRPAYRARALWTRQLATARYFTHDGDLAPAQVGAFAILDGTAGARVLVVVAHLPSHIAQGGGFSNLPRRVGVWRAAVAGLAAAVARARHRWTPDLVVVAVDWNVDLRRPVWRRYLRTRFAAVRLTWSAPLPRVGTYHHRIIDGTLTNGLGRARLLRRTPASDHRPYDETLRTR